MILCSAEDSGTVPAAPVAEVDSSDDDDSFYDIMSIFNS